MRVSEEVMAVLSVARLEGTSLFLPPTQLERKLYESTNKVLEAAGGKWNRKAKAHVFPGDAADAMDQILLTGQVTVPQNFGFFPTPQPIVTQLLQMADLQPHHKALEPSAGIGNIANRLREKVASVDCVELLPKNVEALKAAMPSVPVVEGDFLAIAPERKYDRIVMNPPFAKQADIKHVMHAARFLKNGGRLVSVMASGVKFREDRTAKEFRAFLSDNGGTIEDLPQDSFKESGTAVNTVVITLQAAA